MKFIKSHVRLFEILFCIFSIFLAVMIALYVAGDQNKSTINSAFGLSGTRNDTAEVEGEEETEEVDTNYFPATYSSDSDLISAYEELCQEVEEEGIVLLSNKENALPLAKGSNVSLFGQGANKFIYSTSGSSGGGDSYDSLKDVLEYQNRFNVNPTLWSLMSSTIYSGTYGGDKGNYCDTNGGYIINEAPYSEYKSAEPYTGYTDAAIFVISRMSGEGTDLTAEVPSAVGPGKKNEMPVRYFGSDGSYLTLSDDEYDILDNLCDLKAKGTFKEVIVILNTSATVQLDFLNDYDVDACLWVGNTGSHGAYAIAEVLCGDVNPSGRSVDTYLYNNFSSPAMWSQTYSSEKRASQVYANADAVGLNDDACNNYYAVYVEGIYVGYRYYETRYEDYVMGSPNVGSFDYNADVAFPFGYGLSYTEFEYSDFSVTPNYEDEDETTIESYTVSVTVTNIGSVAGKETVEVYLQKPYTSGGVETASVELVGYAKTDMLDAAGGEDDSQTVEITVDKEQFRSYDTDGAGTYILDAGDYYLTAAKNSHDAVNNILAAKNYSPDSTSQKMDASGDATFANNVLSQEQVDAEIFSTSSETGEEIGNELAFADLNKYENRESNSVTYVSRTDWEGTFPKTNVSITVSSAMYQDLQSDWRDYDDGETYGKQSYGKENGLTMMALRGLPYNDEDGLWEELLDQMTYGEQSYLVSYGYHVTQGVSSVAKPEIVDENGPTAVTGSFTGYCLPSEGIWAATFNDDMITKIGQLMGDDCIMNNIQGLYAPGVNIHRSGFIGRSHEYFSEDPYLSGMAAVDEINGIQSRGVIAYVKHFAFNEQETNRNGISIWLNEQSAREIYLLPFEYAMRPSMGNSHGVMTSFNRAGCKWTSASSELLLDIARGEWGYEGYYITDMSSSNGSVYMTYFDGIMNGTNLYDGNTGSDSALNSWKDNDKFCYMLRESCHRILYNIVNYSAAMNGMTASTRVIVVTNWWQVLIIVLLVIAAVGTVAAIVFYVLAEVFSRKGKGDSGNGGGGVRPRDADDDYDTSGGVTSSDDIE